MFHHFFSLILVVLTAIAANATRNVDGNLIAMSVDRTSTSIPESIDWRELGAVTPVKDRKGCQNGSWAFAAAEAIEAINKIATGTLLELSAQQLLDCSRSYGSSGCKYGFPQQALEFLTDTGNGLALAADYPFTGFNKTCKNPNTYKVSIDNYDNLYGSSDDTDMLEIVANQPVTALIDGNAPEFVNYKGGIYKGPCKDDQATPYLSVLIVGYGSENGDDYWIIKNSAGPNWGEKGYMRLQRGNHGLPLGRCGVNGFVYYPLKEKVVAPPPPSPPPPSPSLPPPTPPTLPCSKRISCNILFPVPCCPLNARPVCCSLLRKCRKNGCSLF